MNQRLSISQFQKQMMAEHYLRAAEYKKEGKPVVYVTATFPVEIVRAFEPDIAIVYPENHAVNLIVNGMAEELAEIAASRKSIDKMGCSYELVNTGYLLSTCFSGDADTGSRFRKVPCLPAPDILLSCNNQCEIVAEWFQNLSRMFGGIPFSVINVGNRYDGAVDRSRIQYVRKQIEDVIRLLEQKTKTKLDPDKLLEIAERSNKATALWREYLDFGTRIPSPMTVFDGFFHMAAIVSERGKEIAVDYYRMLVSETKEKIVAGKSAVENEMHRLLWDNLATWFNFGHLKKYLGERNIAVVGSTYLDVWKNELDTSACEPLLDSMAASYCSMYTNLTIAQRISLWKEMVTKYQAKGILFHNNKSCHTFSRLQGQLAEALKKEFGEAFITILFDGDMGLKERFQKHRFETAIETYF
ncbi:MAG: 2-hydroxyacyl-CoA dehydratase [Desulfobacteraceae bacterium]|nr:MAG: 2-hydroxyacyl-CoA dehydratase [Desulfobacteraceae bacterium]